MGLWDRLLTAGRRLFNGDEPRPAPASTAPPPPPPPPAPRSGLAETIDIELDGLEEIDLDEPTAELERAAPLPAPPPPSPGLRSLGVGGLQPRRASEPRPGALGSLPVAPAPPAPAHAPSARELAASDRFADLFQDAAPPPGPLPGHLLAGAPASLAPPHDWDDDEDEDLRPTVIDDDRGLDEPIDPAFFEAVAAERGLVQPVSAPELDEERDTQADWLGEGGQDAGIPSLSPLDVAPLDDLTPALPRSALGFDPPRHPRRPVTDLTHLTALPVGQPRDWQPGPPPAPEPDEELDLSSEPGLSGAAVGSGRAEAQMEPVDELVRMDREDEASTIDEELFYGSPAPPRPVRPAQVPPALGSPGRVLSAASLFDFATPTRAGRKPLHAAEPEPAELDEDDEPSVELTGPGERRFPNSLDLPDREVIHRLHHEQYPELAHLDTDLLARICRLEAEILERAVALGAAVRALVHELAPDEPLWQGAVWWSGVVGDASVREALACEDDDVSRATLAWRAWPYLHELLSATSGADDPLELGLLLARLERSVAQRRTVVRMGPPELAAELDRLPTAPRGLTALPGFSWTAH